MEKEPNNRPQSQEQYQFQETEGKIIETMTDEQSMNKINQDINSYIEEISKLKEQILRLEKECQNKDELINYFQTTHKEEQNINNIEPNLTNKNEKNLYQFQNNLKNLQTLLMKESVQRELVIQMKNELINQIENFLFEINKNKIQIAEKIDNLNNISDPKSYVFCIDKRNVYKEETKNISRIILFLRKYQTFLFNILINCKTHIEKKCISNLIANFFYQNVFSSDSIEEDYLLLTYRIFDYEIKQLTSLDNSLDFQTNSISSKLIHYIVRNNDVKEYFKNILNGFIDDLNNEENNLMFEFDPVKINEIVTDKQNNQEKNQTDTNTNEINENEQIDDIRNEDLFEDLGNNGENFIDKQTFYNSYVPDITIKELESLLVTHKQNTQMYNYIQKKLNEFNSKFKDGSFTNDLFLIGIYSSKNPSEVLEIYRTSFTNAVNNINKLYINLEKSLTSMPESLRLMIKIIIILIRKKFPKLIDIEIYAFISELFYKNVISSKYFMSKLNHLLISKLLTSRTMNNIEILGFIIKQLLSGQLFNSKNNPNYTIFNRFFIEYMPKIHDFFNRFLDVQLPPLLQKIVQNEETPETKEILSNNFVCESFKQDIIKSTSVCFSPEQIISIVNIMQRHENLFTNLSVDERMKEDYKLFIECFNQLCEIEHIDTLTNVRYEDEYSKEGKITYVSIEELHFSDELQKINKINQGIFFLEEIGQPKDENEKTRNECIKIKNLLSLILSSIHDTIELNCFKSTIKNTQDFVENLIPIMKAHYYQLDNITQIEKYILKLKLLLPNLPDEYKRNDYSKLYNELKNEITQSINVIDFGILGKVKDKSIFVSKELQQTKNHLIELKNLDVIEKIQDFLDNETINVKLTIIQESNKAKFQVSQIEPPNKKQFQLNLGDQSNFQPDLEESHTISQFIRRFPKFSDKKKGKKVFDIQKLYEIPEMIKNYYQIVKVSIKNHLMRKETEKISTEEKMLPERTTKRKLSKKEKELKKEQEKQKMAEIENKVDLETEQIYQPLKDSIMVMLYDKLFPKYKTPFDDVIYNQCLVLSWVKLHHMGIFNHLNIEQFLSVTTELMRQLDLAKTPHGKMAVFSRIVEIILSSLKLCLCKPEEEANNLLQMLLFVVIKSKPEHLASNISFIQLYHHDIYGELDIQNFDLLVKVKDRIIHFSNRDLLNVTEQDYTDNCNIAFNKAIEEEQ